MAQEVETWRNASRGKRGVIKFDRYGNIQHEVINPGRTFTLTRDERTLNQERAATDRLDNFKNGTMVPVKLVDEDDKIAFASNPNLMGDGELRGLFKLHYKKFETQVNAIENEIALDRLAELAVDPEISATVTQSKIIQARLAEVNPQHSTQVTQIPIPGKGPDINF